MKEKQDKIKNISRKVGKTQRKANHLIRIKAFLCAFASLRENCFLTRLDVSRYLKETMRVRQFLIVLLNISVVVAASASAAEKLTLRQCIQVALEKHPSLTAAQENLSASRSRVDQATSPYLPQVQASTGYSENHQTGGGLGDTTTKGYSSTLSVNQTIYDFGKTGNNRRAAMANENSFDLDLHRVRAETILNVKQAYYALLQAKRLVLIAQQTLAQTEGHLKQAEAFFTAGSKPKFEVTRAEVDFNNARLGLINAQNAARIDTIALYNAMGIDPAGDIEIEDAPSATALVPGLAEAQTTALANRPEMRKAESDIEAAKSRVHAEESNYYPTLAANGAYTWSQGKSQGQYLGQPPFGGTRYNSDLQDSWNAGIMLTVPLFQGGLTRAKVGEARANQRALEAQQHLLRQTILLEVSQVYADLENASARISVMDSQLQKARESLTLAEGRYQAGVGQSLDVTDARVAAAKAETDQVQAQHDYQLAIARLNKAMGTETE
jgi:outer membrane protein